MKLELKHIAPYLPYGFKVKHNEYKWVYQLEYATLFHIATYTIFQHICNYNEFKPIIRPMSDLYKPLKDRTYPIAVIGRMYEPNGKLYCEDGIYTYGWNTATGGDDYQGYEIGWIESAGWFGLFFDTYDYENQNKNFTGDYLPYNREIAEYLDKNHFDWRYNLIDQNLAININDIE